MYTNEEWVAFVTVTKFLRGGDDDVMSLGKKMNDGTLKCVARREEHSPSPPGYGRAEYIHLVQMFRDLECCCASKYVDTLERFDQRGLGRKSAMTFKSSGRVAEFSVEQIVYFCHLSRSRPSSRALTVQHFFVLGIPIFRLSVCLFPPPLPVCLSQWIRLAIAVPPIPLLQLPSIGSDVVC